MVLNKGGYVIINKALDNVYELAKNALTSGKPILWYETNTECYFIDTATLSGTDVILTKGGKTITIEADGDITEVGDIQPKKMYNHVIILAFNKPSGPATKYFKFSIYFTSDKSDKLTIDELKTLATTSNNLKVISASGYYALDSDSSMVCGFIYNGNWQVVYGNAYGVLTEDIDDFETEYNGSNVGYKIF